ncbi:MAG: hypothetical protein ACXWL5_00630 [Candidatus Chromulinivorax sp.]
MMKKFLFVTVVALFLGSVISLDARNKPQIFLTNEYNKDILVVLKWKDRNFPYGFHDQEVKLLAGAQNLLVKPDYSTFDLHAIYAVPAKNLELAWADVGLFAGLGASWGAGLATGVAVANKFSAEVSLAAGLIVGLTGEAASTLIYNIMYDKNHIKMENVHNHKFFVFEKGKKELATKHGKQKQLVIREYRSKDHYNQEVAKQDKKIEAVIA